MKFDKYTYSYEEKCKMVAIEKNKMYEKLSKYKINEHTMYRLVRYIDKDKIKEKKYLFEFLFYYSNLIGLCKQNQQKSSHNVTLRITKEKNENDILLYGVRYQKDFW